MATGRQDEDDDSSWSVTDSSFCKPFTENNYVEEKSSNHGNTDN